MMYKEILNNVVLHASASEVSISVGWEDGRFSLVVKDNGRGFDVDTTPEGNGLRNLRARSQHIGGALSIVSSPSSGTTVSLELEIT
jgi:signal transduction histidine kinase